MVRQEEQELTLLTKELKGAREVLNRELARRGEVETKLQRYISEADLTFENAPVIDVIVNKDGKIVKANHAATRFLRQPIDVVQGAHFCTVFNCSRATNEDNPNHSAVACEKCPLRRAFEETDAANPRILPLLADGRGRRHRLLVSSYAFTHGKDKLVLLSLEREPHDRSRQRELERLFKLDCLGILARSIAMDVSQLVDGIRQGVDGALDCSDVDETIREQLVSAREAVLRAADLSSELLTVARVGNQKVQVLDVSSLLEAVADGFRQKTSTEITVNCQNGLWGVEGDGHLIGQAMKHVMNNACEAATKYGRVDISAENVVEPVANKIKLLSGRYVKITISDSGPGIPSEQCEKVTEPFFTTKEDKHGLGLSAACLIAQQQGGTLQVESEVGSGTRANIYLLCEHYPQNDLSSTPAFKEGRLLAFSPTEVAPHELFRRAVELGEAGE